MFQKILSYSKIALLTSFTLTCLPSFAMDHDNEKASTRNNKQRPFFHKKTDRDDDNPSTTVNFGPTTATTATTTTTTTTATTSTTTTNTIKKTYYNKEINVVRNKNSKNEFFINDDNISPELQKRKLELDLEEDILDKLLVFPDTDLDFKHPLKDALIKSIENQGDTFSQSSIIGYYKYDDPSQAWDAPSMFFRELDKGFFIQPICKKTRVIQTFLGAVGMTVPVAWGPLVMYLSQKLITFIPIDGSLSMGIFATVFVTTGPPCAAQGWKFGEQIGDVFFDNNGFTAKASEEDKKPHIQPKTFPIIARIFSTLGAFQRTLPYPLLYWSAQKFYQFPASFFIYQFAGSIFKKTYDENMDFWKRVGHKSRGHLTGIKIKNLIDSLKSNMELINKDGSDDLVDLLYASIRKEIEDLQLAEEKRITFHEKFKKFLLLDEGEEMQNALFKYVEEMVGNKLNGKWKHTVQVTMQKHVRTFKEAVKEAEQDNHGNLSCCGYTIPLPNFSWLPLQDKLKASRKEDIVERELSILFKKIGDALQQQVRAIKIESAMNGKKSICKALKNELSNTFFSSKSNEEFGFPSLFYNLINQYVNQNHKIQPQNFEKDEDKENASGGVLGAKVKEHISQLFAKMVKTEIESYIKEVTGKKTKKIITSKLFNVFKASISQQSLDKVHQRLALNENLFKSISEYLRMALYSVRILYENASRGEGRRREIIVFYENDKLYYQIDGKNIIEIAKEDYKNTSQYEKVDHSKVLFVKSDIFNEIYKAYTNERDMNEEAKDVILQTINLEDLYDIAKDIKKKAIARLLSDEHCDPLIEQVYFCIQKEIGNAILKNGLAVPARDISISAFSMLLRKLELPATKAIRKDHAGLIDMLEASQASDKQSENSSLLENDEQKKAQEALSIVKELKPDRSQAFLDLIAYTKFSFSKIFSENSAIFFQGDAKNGRIVVATWAANHLLRTWGINPQVCLGLALGYAGLDALMRPLQEWYLQKDTYQSVYEDASTININISKCPSITVENDYWFLRGFKKLGSIIGSSYLTLPTVAIILEMIPGTEWWLKAPIILAASQADFASLYHYLDSQWNYILRGGVNLAMAGYQSQIDIKDFTLKSPWMITTSQKRAYLNGLFERAIYRLPDFHEYTLDELHANTQGTD